MRTALLITLAASLSAATYEVGPGTPTPTIMQLPKVLVAGDMIDIQPGVYTDARVWPIAGTEQNPVRVHCIGPFPCDFNGKDTDFQFTPRATFEIADGWYTFTGPFFFRNVHNGGNNAAALRVIKGGLVADGFKVRNADNGVKSSHTATSTTLRNCDIGWSGRGSAAGHSVYIEGDRLLIENCKFDRTIGGIHMKARARNVMVRNVELLDSVDGEFQCADGESTGTPGADCTLEDSVVRTLAKKSPGGGLVGGNCCRVIAFGNEGQVRDRVGTLRLYRNKFTISAPNQILASLDSVNAALDTADNEIQGTPNLVRIRYGTSGPITGKNDKVSPTLIPPPPPAPPSPWSIVNGLPKVFVEAPSPTNDITPPTVPTNIKGVNKNFHIEVTWTPSTDAGGIERYEIIAPYGPFWAGTDNTFPYFIGNSATYYGRQIPVQIVAVDFSGNKSLPSPVVTFTRAAPVP